jgi:hypothetical protein
MAAVGRLERTMSDHLGLPLPNQVRVGGPAWGAEMIPWGSTDALEAVKRICQGVTVRCHQAIRDASSGGYVGASGRHNDLTQPLIDLW